MKKYILTLFLLSSIFFEFNFSKAQTITASSVTNVNTGVNGLASSPVAGTSSNYAVGEYLLVGSGSAATGTITSLSFYSAGTTGSNDNTYYTTAYLYQSTSSTYVPGTTNVSANLVGSAPADAGYTVTIPTNLTVSNTTNVYLFLVLSNTLGNTVNSTFVEQLNNYTGTATVSLSGNGKGPAYKFSAATPVTSTATSIGTQGTNGLTASPITSPATGLPVFGLQLVQSATGSERSITALNFTGTAVPAQNENYFFSTAYLYSSPSSTFSAGTAKLVSTITPGASTALNFTGLNILLDPGTTLYYFLVVDYSPNTAVAETWQPKLASTTSNTTVTGTPAGYNYTITTPTPVTITATSLGTPGTSGLTTNPIGTLGTNLPIYGLQLTASATGATKNLTALTFTSTAGQADNYYFANFYLYSSTSSTFPGAGNSGATLVKSVAADGTNTVSFTNLTIPVAAGATLYYFVLVDYTTYIAAASSTFRLNWGSATGATIATGAGNQGNTYTVTSPTYAITTNTAGIPAANSTYNYGTTGDVLESFGVTSTGPATFSGFTLKTYINGATGTPYTTYFSNLTVYSSSNPNYAADLAGTGSPLTAVPVTISGTTTVTITLNTAQGLGSTPIYYFVVGDFTNGDNLFTSTTAPTTTFQFRLTAATASVSATSSFPINYNSYNLASPVALGTATTTGLATSGQLSYNQTQVGIMGFSISTNQNETINQVNMSVAISSFNSSIGTFFSNFTLYVNTTNSLTGATQVTGATFSSLSSSTVLTISTMNQVINNTTMYYFIKADFTAPNTYASTFQLVANSVVDAANIVYTAGAPINGIVYNLSPPVLLGTATTTGLATNPITAAGTNVGIFGFSVFSGPGYTFTQFNLSSVQPSGQYLGTNFSNYQLYVSTTNSFSAATLVSGATFSPIAASNTLTITGLSQAIPVGTTYYYFIKVTYTPPSIATTYELNLNSVQTATNTYTTGGPIYGTNYTLTGPLGVYYYTGAAFSIAWENQNNWLNAYTGTNSGYPGQSSNADIAVFSPTYEQWYISNITATKTIGQIIVQANNTTSFTLEIKNGLTCSVTNGITLGDAGQLNTNNTYFSQLQLAETSNNGTGIFYISGTSALYNDGSLAIAANAVFSSGASVNMYGTTADPAFLGMYAGANVTGSNNTFNCTGAGGEIYGQGGTFAVTSSTLNFSGLAAQMFADGGAMTLTGCTVNATGTSNNNNITGLGLDAGSLTVTGSSVVNLGTSSSNGAFTTVNSGGGTFTLSGNSTLNLLGNSTNISNDYYVPSALGTMNITASTINMGSSVSASDGVGSQILNSSTFNLNGLSVINMNGANTTMLNTSTTYGGTTYPGIVIGASTSVINPSSTTAVVNNTMASNYFTLLSDASASATIGRLGVGAKLTGKYNVQRYLRGGASYLRNYTLLSSPVNTNAFTSNVNNTIDLTYLGAQATIPTATPTTYYGAFIAGPGAGFGGGIHTITNPLIYLYQENLAPGANYNKAFSSGKNVGVVSLNTSNSTVGTLNTAAGAGDGSTGSSPSVPSSPTGLPAYDNATGVAVPPGNGYILYYIDNDARTTAASGTSVPNASNVTASGYINQGQVQLYMWGSKSANLTDTYGIAGVRLPGITVVGNPYPSTIDLQQVYADNAGAITPTLYQLDKTTEQFDAYNAATHSSSTTMSSQYVGSGLGFYIHVDSLGSTKQFYFQEDQKTPSATAGFYPPVTNFSVVTNPDQPVIDNINGTNGSVNADALQKPGSSPTNTNSDQTAANAATGGIRADNLATASAATDQSANDAKQGASTAAAIGARSGSRVYRKLPVAPVREYKPETPQPAQKPLPPAIANLAGLHLKFVVDSVTNDEIGVYFNKAWADKYDNNDSFDMDGNSGKAYLSSYSSDGVRTSVNTMGDYTGGKRVKLFVKASTDGIFQLQMTDITSGINTKQYSVFLIDNLKKDSLDLTLYKSYNFNYAVADTASYSNRFVLAIEHKPVAHYALVNFAGQKVTKGVQLNWETKNEANTTLFVLQKLTSNNSYAFLDSTTSVNSGSYDYVDLHPSLGSNTYRLQQTDALGNMTYSAPVTIGYNSTAPNGGLNIYPNPSKSIINISLTTNSTATRVATADIYNASGTLVAHKVVNANSFNHDVSNYQLGVYIVELKNGNGAIVGKSKFVKVQ